MWRIGENMKKQKESSLEKSLIGKTIIDVQSDISHFDVKQLEITLDTGDQVIIIGRGITLQIKSFKDKKKDLLHDLDIKRKELNSIEKQLKVLQDLKNIKIII